MTEPMVQSTTASALPSTTPAATAMAPARLPRPGMIFLLVCAVVGAFVGLAGVLVGYGLSTMVL
ncbi:MAG: hypothetical protein WCS09_01865 [Pseudomonadota bacterium]|jgi:hypothetical protein